MVFKNRSLLPDKLYKYQNGQRAHGQKGVERRRGGETLALGNKNTRETDWALCRPISDRRI